MKRKQKYHFIYKTVNLITNRFYMGMHSTHNLEDGYLGSGKILLYSIRKYGRENHKIEILEFLDNSKKLKRREKELVNKDIVNHPLCMNLKVGGKGGFSDEDQRELSARGVKALKEKRKDPEFVKNCGDRISHSLTERFKVKKHNWNGRTHKDKTKDKIGETNSIKQKGKRNSQFGTHWINNNKENKKIKKEELQNWINLGWIKGRK